MVGVAYRHGLRASELVDLRWDEVDFRTATLRVRREHGTPSTHPILGEELRALRRLQREQESRSPFVFTSERGAPFSTAGFARMVERAGNRRRSRLQGASEFPKSFPERPPARLRPARRRTASFSSRQSRKSFLWLTT
jgi:integrase